jgi:hypothetical protein
MALNHHDDTELMAGTDWAIAGTLLDVDGNPLDLSNATLQWTLIGPDGLPVLQNGDATITITGTGTINIAVHHTVTATLDPARYLDALQLSIGDVISPLWIGVILVAANPRSVLPA